MADDEPEVQEAEFPDMSASAEVDAADTNLDMIKDSAVMIGEF